MLKELINQLSDQPQAALGFQQSVDRLRSLGKEWESLNPRASYYIVQSSLANSAALMWGDIRVRTSYSAIITLFLDDDGFLKVSTVNYENFLEEDYQIVGTLSDEIIWRCLSSSYNKSIITNLTTLLNRGDDQCAVKIRTGVFWSDMSLAVVDCNKIFNTLFDSPKSFEFQKSNNIRRNQNIEYLPYDFMRQTNQISINGIKFRVRIRGESITFETLVENDSVKIFK